MLLGLIMLRKGFGGGGGCRGFVVVSVVVVLGFTGERVRRCYSNYAVKTTYFHTHTHTHTHTHH